MSVFALLSGVALLSYGISYDQTALLCIGEKRSGLREPCAPSKANGRRRSFHLRSCEPLAQLGARATLIRGMELCENRGVGDTGRLCLAQDRSARCQQVNGFNKFRRLSPFAPHLNRPADLRAFSIVFLIEVPLCLSGDAEYKPAVGFKAEAVSVDFPISPHD